jgi:steroid delta-isomerase-like uncharacterized protein
MPMLRVLMFVIVATTVVTGGPTATPGADDDANAAIVRTMTDAVNRRDLDALDAVVAPDVVRHSAATAGVTVRSLEDFKAFLRSDFATVPDSVIEVRHLIAQGDLVAVHAVYSGTQQGPMGPFPPTGKRVEGPFLSFLRIEDGKIAEMWVEWDNLSMLTQLGHLPPPAASPAAPDVRRVVAQFEAAWNGNAEAASDLVADDVEYLEVPTGRRSENPEAVVSWIEETRAWVPDFTIRTVGVTVCGDHVTWEWIMEGTQTGAWPELRSTNRPFAVPGVSVLTLRDGRIATGRNYWDMRDLSTQLGLIGEETPAR